MALFADRVKETSTTTGAGNFTLAGAATGFRTFASIIPIDRFVYYAIVGTTEWEVGEGYLSNATTLVRSKVMSSSNGGNIVTFSAGTKDVFCTAPASELSDKAVTTALRQGFLDSALPVGF